MGLIELTAGVQALLGVNLNINALILMGYIL